MLDRIVTGAMVLGGLLTLTMLYAAIDPAAATAMMLGEAVPTGAGEIVVRNWGLLVGGVGALLIVGAFHHPWRRLALGLAVVSKLAFIALVVLQGQAYASIAATALAVDSVAVVVFSLALVALRPSSAV